MEFNILGPLEVTADGRPVDLGRPKQRAVLAILLLHAGRAVSLEHLVDELWGDDPPAQSIGSLQAYVSHLRRLLEPGRDPRTPAQVLVSRPPGYQIVASLDANRFEALAAEGRRLLAAGRPDRAADTLRRALALWRGDVLADFPDAPFARAERARLAELRLDAAEDRVAADLAAGRHSAAVAELDRLVADHPYRESLHALRMLALYRAGRQADALRAYQEIRRLLADELGIEPGPQLTTVHRQILSHAPELDRPPYPSSESAEPQPAEPQPAEPEPGGEVEPARNALVGRAEPLAALRRALDETRTGSGRVVLLAGEPGVGKTRLAAELARTAAGFAVAWGHCGEEPGAPQFWPWTQVLRELPAAEPPPELVGDPAPGPPVADVEAVRFRLCRELVALLERLAADRPLLLVIDDLQWADAGSLRLLPMLAGAGRILVVATFRDVGTAGPALTDALAALARRPAVERIPLHGLGEPDVRRLLAARLGAEPDERLARVVHDRSGGNPFFVLELARLLGSERRLAAAESAATQSVPDGVRDVVRRRVSGLPEQTQAILLVAAVVGREFALDLVRDVSGLDDDTALDAVEAALLSGLVIEAAEVGRFRFTHALVREAIYHEVSRVRRARLHARVAEELSRRGETAGDQWWLAAPVAGVRVALPHLLAAADRALASLTHEEAERHLRNALELLATEPSSADRARSEFDVQMRLSTLYAQLDGAQSASGRVAVTRARELAEELADVDAMIAAYRGLYEVAVARAEHAEARELAERMLEVGKGRADPASLALVHLAMGRTLWCLGEPAAARDHLEQSLGLAVVSPTPPHESLPVDITVRLQLAPVLDLLGRRAEADRHLDDAIARTRSAAPLARAGVLTSAALVCALRRDVPAAGRHARQALELAGPVPAWFSYAAAVSSWVRALEVDPVDGARALRVSLDEIRSRGSRHLVAWVLGLLAEAEALAGRPAEAVRLLDEADALVALTGERMYEAELRRLRGSLTG